jgi:hypothetical protein
MKKLAMNVERDSIGDLSKIDEPLSVRVPVVNGTRNNLDGGP